MKVRVTQGFVGKDRFTYLQGQVCDFNEARATSLIENGLAEAVVSHKVNVTATKTKAKKVAVRIKGRRGEKDGQ